jgi:hypothetical protein
MEVSKTYNLSSIEYKSPFDITTLSFKNSSEDSAWITNPSCDGLNFVWKTKEETWTFKAVMDSMTPDVIDYFEVGEDCPYVNQKYTTTEVKYIDAISTLYSETS